MVGIHFSNANIIPEQMDGKITTPIHVTTEVTGRSREPKIMIQCDPYSILQSMETKLNNITDELTKIKNYLQDTNKTTEFVKQGMAQKYGIEVKNLEGDMMESEFYYN